MKINKIDHIGIRVADFDRSTRFYAKLGFEVIREDFKERVVVARHPSGITVNFLDSANNHQKKQNILMDTEDKYPGYTHYAIHIDSIADALAYLKSNEMTITKGPVTFGNEKTSIFIRDPDLNQNVLFVINDHFIMKKWRTSGGSEPLRNKSF